MIIYRTIKNGKETKHYLDVLDVDGKIYGFLQLNPEDEWDEDHELFDECCDRLKLMYGSRFKKFTLKHSRI
ncbi:hypothetical protein MP477_20605 [Chryseobacterium sp. WG23]|uniref:hypothetical protein n=1 Tax=Chryseobacterium sp. WG23 TaxID=2926910 RepID=UPI00211DA93C|nr:hypothetical protein [Chryseobacterium sp. WG23]MCQ9637357.1 hypothetical protein [Chryseobacterium sp. WG23]